MQRYIQVLVVAHKNPRLNDSAMEDQRRDRGMSKNQETNRNLNPPILAGGTNANGPVSTQGVSSHHQQNNSITDGDETDSIVILDNEDDEDSDDLAIVGTRMRSPQQIVDLDNEPELSTIPLRNNSNVDDDLTILEERHIPTATRSESNLHTIPLHLPGGNTIQVNVNDYERPHISSFMDEETRRDRRSSRNRNQNRNRRIHSTVMNEVERMAMLRMLMRDQQNGGQDNISAPQLGVSVSDAVLLPSLNNIYPDLNTARLRRFMLENIHRTTGVNESDGDYVPLNVGLVSGNGNTRRRRNRNQGPVSPRTRARRLRRERDELTMSDVENGYDMESDDFYSDSGDDNDDFTRNQRRRLNNSNNIIGGVQLPSFNQVINAPTYREFENRRTENIISFIQQREDRERDTKVKILKRKSEPLKQKYLEESKAIENEGTFTTHFKTFTETETATDEATSQSCMVPSCVLCGIELGTGIPDDYQGTSEEDKKLDFEELVSKYQFPCPYQSLFKPTQLDRDLSKRTYISNGCGHTFCGRCYARIDNAKGKGRMSKKKLEELKGSSNPNIYGPKICPAKNCDSIIRAKNKLKEVYF